MKVYRVWLSMERAVSGTTIKEYTVRASNVETAIQIVFAREDVFPHLIVRLHIDTQDSVVLTEEDGKEFYEIE